MDAQGTTDFERAVARAYGSRVGLGGTKLHVGGEAGPAETVYLGVFRRDRLLEVGLFDEEIKRGQDWELNRRLRHDRRHRLVHARGCKVTYRPRPNLYRLARQFFSTGIWRGELARRFPASNGLRYFAPPVMVLGVAVGTLLGLAGIVQAILGAAPWLLWGFAIPAVYVVIVVVSALLWGRRDGFRPFLWFLVVLPCIHFSWGIGFVLGYLSLTRNITAHTGR